MVNPPLIRLFEGDSLDVLRATPDGTYTYVVTDPPYGLSTPPDPLEVMRQWLAEGDYVKKARNGKVAPGKGFLGAEWDHFVPGPVLWREVFRTCKPGAIVLCFAATRTMDWMSLSLRCAGFEILDTIAWLQAQGMAKAGTIDKKIDARRDDCERLLACTRWIRERCAALGLKAADLDRACGTNGMGSHWTRTTTQLCVPTPEQWARLEPLLGVMPDTLTAMRETIDAREPGADWAKREVVAVHDMGDSSIWGNASGTHVESLPGTETSAVWAGWSTQLAPGFEPIIVARRPCEGTATANVLKHGCGAMNIDACRIAGESTKRFNDAYPGGYGGFTNPNGVQFTSGSDAGRWPKNVLLSGEAAAVLDLQVGERKSGSRPAGSYKQRGGTGIFGPCAPRDREEIKASTGGASRYFWVGPLATEDDLALPGRYVAKVRSGERHAGLENIELIKVEGSWEGENLEVQLHVDVATSPPRVTGASGATTKIVNDLSMCLFGNEHMVPSPRGCRFTIETETNSTTASRTLKFLRASLTSESTAGVSGETESSSSPAGSAGLSTPLTTTTSGPTGSLLRVDPVPSPGLLRISSAGGLRNPHPCLKPQALMEWLCRLVGHPQGRGLDPFAGSGSTLRAARSLGLDFDGIERDPTFAEIARHRAGIHGEASTSPATVSEDPPRADPAAPTAEAATTTQEAFVAHLDAASAKVREWPEWKRDVLGRTPAEVDEFAALPPMFPAKAA